MNSDLQVAGNGFSYSESLNAVQRQIEACDFEATELYLDTAIDALNGTSKKRDQIRSLTAILMFYKKSCADLKKHIAENNLCGIHKVKYNLCERCPPRRWVYAMSIVTRRNIDATNEIRIDEESGEPKHTKEEIEEIIAKINIFDEMAVLVEKLAAFVESEEFRRKMAVEKARQVVAPETPAQQTKPRRNRNPAIKIEPRQKRNNV